MMRPLLISITFVFLIFAPAAQAKDKSAVPAPTQAEEIKPPQDYLDFLRKLKKEMVKRGISQATIDKVYAKNYYHPEPEVVKLDRKQAEFVMRSTDYLNRIVTAKRVHNARAKYKDLHPLLADLEEKYGVAPEYIIAFWGIETNFVETFGGFEVIDALTALAYDKRRRQFFTEELYHALKIIDTYHFEPEQMQGSWAGAMGHFQFMPSTLNAYGVDYDNDGRIDIWHSFKDAAASAANYLSAIGWRRGEPWGAEVTVPWDFDYSLSGRHTTKTIAEWKELGVKAKNGHELAFADDLKAALIMPEGRRGHIYLILPNFYRIMEWNRSENYALAVSTLADYIKNNHKYHAFSNDTHTHIKTKDIEKIQAFINKLELGKVKEDGQLGSTTKEAVKVLQKKAGLPADGYPDNRLLQKIDAYNPEAGFVIPVPPYKPEYKGKIIEKK